MIIKIRKLLCRHFFIKVLFLLFCLSIFLWNHLVLLDSVHQQTKPIEHNNKSDDRKDALAPDKDIPQNKKRNQFEISESDKILLAGKIRQGFLVIGVPTARRIGANYILGTLRELVKNLTEEEKEEIVIVVFSSEFDPTNNQQVKDLVMKEFSKELDRGLIHVISAPTKWYSTLEKLPSLWGDKPDRVKWRSKQCLDYSYLFTYCANLGIYYLQIEDDVIVEPNYLKSIKQFLELNKNEKWSILEFGARGFIGMLYRSEDLPRLARFVKMYYWIWPVDFLFRQFNDFHLHGNSPKFVFKPVLFKHIGKYSTLEGQIRKLEDINKTKPKGVVPHKKNKNYIIHLSANNPLHFSQQVWMIKSAMEEFKEYTVKKVEEFWAKNIKLGDDITMKFIKPIMLARFIMETTSRKAIYDYPGGVVLKASGATSNSTDDGECGEFSVELQEYKEKAHIEFINEKFPKLKIKCLQIVISRLLKDSVGNDRCLLVREIAVWII